ncbi:MAG: glycosyltransferase involved in cell wall biosynthesis [Flammeovirgaceae bacterium]|jgi:glycosyltransferase involved in cell wall biosynthesis
MKDKPHILFISSWYPSPSTSEGTFVELHLLALQSRGCKCAILLNGETTFGNYVKAGFDKAKLLNFRKRDDITFVDNLAFHKRPLRFAKDPIAERKENILNASVKNLKTYISAHGKPDVIFHHGIFDYTYISAHLSEVFGIPIWYMENSPNIEEDFFPCANPFTSDEERKNFVQNVDRRFAVTNAYVVKMERIFKAPFELVPNVITDDFFVSNPKPRSKKPFVFCNVAIMDSRKRQDLIIEAFAEAFGGDDNYRLVIAGDGKLKQSLIDLVQKLDVSAQVDIPGYLNRDEVKDLLDRSNAFVLASRAETFGVVVIEAMARGIPTISSNIDGTKEIINSTNGIVFEEGSKQGLTAAFRQLVLNYDIYDPKKIVEDVKSRFGPDAVKKGLYKE